jgi:hypothetical protein
MISNKIDTGVSRPNQQTTTLHCARTCKVYCSDLPIFCRQGCQIETAGRHIFLVVQAIEAVRVIRPHFARMNGGKGERTTNGKARICVLQGKCLLLLPSVNDGRKL